MGQKKAKKHHKFWREPSRASGSFFQREEFERRRTHRSETTTMKMTRMESMQPALNRVGIRLHADCKPRGTPMFDSACRVRCITASRSNCAGGGGSSCRESRVRQTMGYGWTGAVRRRRELQNA